MNKNNIPNSHFVKSKNPAECSDFSPVSILLVILFYLIPSLSQLTN